MDFTDFAAGSDDGGRRVDRVLRRFLYDANLSSVYGALRKGLILVNAQRVKPDARIESGDVISIASFLLQNENSSDSETNPNENRRLYKAASLPYTVVFANEHFLVIDKPYGVAVQGKIRLPKKSSSITMHPCRKKNARSLLSRALSTASTKIRRASSFFRGALKELRGFRES